MKQPIDYTNRFNVTPTVNVTKEGVDALIAKLKENQSDMTISQRYVKALLDEARRLVRQLPLSALQATADGMTAMMHGDMDEARYRFALSRELVLNVPRVMSIIEQIKDYEKGQVS